MARKSWERGTMPTWKAVSLALAFFAAGLLIWYIVPGLLSRDTNTHLQSETSGTSDQPEIHRRFDPAADKRVTLGDAVLVPTGQPVTLNKNALAPVETSREGIVLWSTTSRPGGGGGTAATGGQQAPAVGSALGPVYVELADGRFQRLKQVQGNTDYPNPQ